MTNIIKAILKTLLYDFLNIWMTHIALPILLVVGLATAFFPSWEVPYGTVAFIMTIIQLIIILYLFIAIEEYYQCKETIRHIPIDAP